MLLLEKLVGLYAPHTCVGCNREDDALLCTACRNALPIVPSRCYRCRAVSRDFTTCSRCRRNSPLGQVYVAAHYEGAAKELLHVAKYERARAGITEMAEHMAPLLDRLHDDMLFVPVPTATSRVRQRGYDQAEVLAARLARLRTRPYVRCLARISQAHQVGSGRKERLKHLENAFRVISVDRLAGTHIVLVDDVLTTGATLETAARLLKKAGAQQVDALVFAQAG